MKAGEDLVLTGSSSWSRGGYGRRALEMVAVVNYHTRVTVDQIYGFMVSWDYYGNSY